MESSKARSFFQDVRSRELSGFRVRKRPYVDDFSVSFSEAGAMAVEHDGIETPPLAVSFCKTSKNSHILAMSDEEGYLSLFDTRKEFPSSASYQENAEKATVSAWEAHQNAVFDICWIKEDAQILTASGDQTVKLWDVQQKKCIGVLMEHTGSVKSLCRHPTNTDIIVSGSRDGSFAMWDLRCNAFRTKRGKICISPTAKVIGAHVSSQAKRVRSGKAVSMSITSVLYIKDEISLASAGAVDSLVKFWDTRNLKHAVTQTCPQPGSTKKERSHGISSLSQDSNGILLTASCMDNRIYLYDILCLDKGPIKTFSGCHIGSFFIKSAISPDAAHILSGSSDGKAYIWQVNKPQENPITLNSHDGEVTAVDWCAPEAGKVATCSDDFTVRTWNMETSSCSGTKTPSSNRRRIMAIPSGEIKYLKRNQEASALKLSASMVPSDAFVHPIISANFIPEPRVSTPEGHKKKASQGLALQETCEKTPEAASKSPSSVLNPPSSLKRKTIRDYFLVGSS